MMPMRDLILHNVWWKLFSLLLAVAIWLYVDATTPKSPTVKRNPVSGESFVTFHDDLPVMIFTEGGDPHVYEVLPGKVKVTLSGDSESLNATILAFEEAVQAFVDVKSVPRPLHPAEVTNEFNLRVQVRTPFGDITGAAEPGSVTVRQYPAGHSLLKTSDKPKP